MFCPVRVARDCYSVSICGTMSLWLQLRNPDGHGFAKGPLWAYRQGRQWRVGVAGASRKCPRTHCRPRNQEWKTRRITDAYLCLQGDLGHDYVFNCRSEPSWRYYVCFDCSGHPAVPCRVWHGKAGDITRCGVSPRVLGRLLGFGTAGGSLLQWPTQMINEQVRPLL